MDKLTETKGKIKVLSTKLACPIYPQTYAAYSRKVILFNFCKGEGFNFRLEQTRKARDFRVMWFMRAVGNMWLTGTDIVDMGACTGWEFKRVLKDMLMDGMIEVDYRDKGIKKEPIWRLTPKALEILEKADLYVLESLARGMERVAMVRDRIGRRDNRGEVKRKKRSKGKGYG